ncbi:MAG: Ig-like domain-containing protein [Lachnospiraceae bacterium]
MGKLKRSICLILSMILLAGSMAVPERAYAAEKVSYRYVALGDSIASGLTLTEGKKGGEDPALILNDELLVNPVKAAYPAVFGEMLAGLAGEKGIKAETVNLSTTGYLAPDIVKTIQASGYKAELYGWMLDNFVRKGASKSLSNYHTYFETYLKDADLVSIQLGADDIVMGALAELLTSDNPVLQAAREAALGLFNGEDVDTALSDARKALEKRRSELTSGTFSEAVRLLSETVENLGNLIQNAADQVKGVVEAVKEAAPGADIALVGMYNPYDISGETEKQVRELGAALTDVLLEAVDLLIEKYGGSALLKDAASAEEEVLAGASTSNTAESISKTLRELESIALVLRLTKDYADIGKLLQKAVNLLQGVSEEDVESVEFMLLGQNISPYIKAYNEKLAKVAEETGATYVDVFDVGSERNIDPHPTAESHQEIASRLYAAMSSKASAKIEKMAGTITLDRSSASVLVGNTVQLKAAAAGEVTWKSSNTKVAAVSKKGLVTAKGIGTATITALLKSGAKAVCKVTVSCRYVYQCVKNGVYRYTTSTSTVKKLKKAGWSYKKAFRAPGAGQKVYQVLDKTTKRYRYSTNLAFAKLMKKAGNTVTTAFYYSAKKTVPVYEYTNGKTKETFRYVSSAADRKSLKKAGWRENGVAWYAEPAKA